MNASFISWPLFSLPAMEKGQLFVLSSVLFFGPVGTTRLLNLSLSQSSQFSVRGAKKRDEPGVYLLPFGGAQLGRKAKLCSQTTQSPPHHTASVTSQQFFP